MKTNCKIFLLPLFILLIAVSSNFYKKSFIPYQTNFSKSLPVPLKQVPKTELTKTPWSKDSLKSYSTPVVCLPVIKIIKPRISFIIRFEEEIYYSSIGLNIQSNRAPPLFFC